MKKTIIALLTFCISACFAGEANLIVDPTGANKFKNWFNPPTAKITSADGIITITDNPDPKFNGYQKASQSLKLKAEEIQGKKFELSFKYRTAKLNGSLQVAVREAFGKTSFYHGPVLKKWDVSPDWKEMKCTFTPRKEAFNLTVYIVGSYMKPGEKVEIKDLKVVAL